jgi:hypothetical protein
MPQIYQSASQSERAKAHLICKIYIVTLILYISTFINVLEIHACNDPSARIYFPNIDLTWSIRNGPTIDLFKKSALCFPINTIIWPIRQAKWLCGVFLSPQTTSQGRLFKKVYCWVISVRSSNNLLSFPF